MPISYTNPASIWITRTLPVDGAQARFECRPGELTILADRDGQDLGYFEQAFRASQQLTGIRILREDASVDLTSIERLGFEDRLGVNLSIPEYLRSIGLTEMEVENVLLEFDLDRVRYLSCSQLPLPAARQLQIFELLRRDWNILFLRDPFQPLNGRWREDFARRILEEVKRRSAIAIASSVSFTPQSWHKIGICHIDVGQACAEATARAVREREIRERNQSISTEKVSTEKGDTAAPPSQPGVVITPTVVSTYKVVADYVFEPLASLSNLLRNNTSAMIVLALLLTTGLIASIAVPGLSERYALLRAIAAKSPQPQQSNKVHQSEAVDSQASSSTSSPERSTREESSKPDSELTSEEAFPPLAEGQQQSAEPNIPTWSTLRVSCLAFPDACPGKLELFMTLGCLSTAAVPFGSAAS
ncbi:MAG: hypothetical protein J0M12_01980 [Deltaproteobacteria bacterium]|nr:hypothetical protein [Deltaproteobacteria bacterium]